MYGIPASEVMFCVRASLAVPPVLLMMSCVAINLDYLHTRAALVDRIIIGIRIIYATMSRGVGIAGRLAPAFIILRGCPYILCLYKITYRATMTYELVED